MSQDILSALKKTAKGQLKYDRKWLEEGRGKEVLNFVYQLNKINIPKGVKITCDLESPTLHFGLSKTPPATNLKSGETSLLEGRQFPSNTSTSISSSSDESSNCDQDVYLEFGHETCGDLVSYEEDRKKIVDEKLKMRLAEKEQYENVYKKQLANQIDLLRETQQLKLELQITQLMKLNEAQLKEMDNQQQEMKKNQRHAKRLGDKIKQAEQKTIEIEERQRKEAKMREDAKKLLQQYYEGLQSVSRTIDDLLSKCHSPQFLEMPPQDRKTQIDNVRDSLGAILKKNSVSESDFLQTQGLLSLARSILMEVNQDVNNAKLKEQAMLSKPLSPGIIIETVKSPSAVPILVPTESALKNPPSPTQIRVPSPIRSDNKQNQTMSLDSYKVMHRNLINNHATWENEYGSFLKDDQLKSYRFNLQKAINLPLNSVSTVSGVLLHEKIESLSALLSGRYVTVGTKKISIKDHPAAIYFCADHVAKKFVYIAEVSVSSHHESAFPLASVAVSLWNQFPKVGELLIYHLYSRCPYLTPGTIIWPKDKSDQNAFFKALGYLFVDDRMEEEKLFLKRMTGIVRFYAAILISSPSPNHQRPTHPHGLRHGWNFLARLLQTEPWHDITATLLFDFLEVCGHHLFKTYSQQFKKILHILCRDYFQLLKKLETQGQGESTHAPIARLESFLHSTIKMGRILPPRGLLDSNFWYTTYN